MRSGYRLALAAALAPCVALGAWAERKTERASPAPAQPAASAGAAAGDKAGTAAGTASPEALAEVERLNAQVVELTRNANYTDALAAAEQGADKAKAAVGEMSAEFARALSWQAYLQQLRGRLASAEPLFQKSLAIYEKVLPPGHPDIATAINNLGFHYQITDKLDLAETLYKRALEMREKALPADDARIADSLNNVAQVYKREGRVEEAEPLHKRALEIRAKALDPDDPLIAQSLTNIGSTIEIQGRFKDAEPYYRKAMDIRRKAQVPDHPEIAGLLNKLAQNLTKQGRYAEAEKMFADAIEMRYRMQSADHPDIATTLNDSAVNLLAEKKFGEAKSQLRTALAIRQAALPPLDPAIADTQATLARVELAEGHPEQALALMRVAVVSQAARGKKDDVARQHFSDFVSMAWAVYKKQDGTPGSRLFTEALEMAQRASQTETEAEVARMTARFASKDGKLEAAIRDRQELDRDAVRLERQLSAVLAVAPGERGTAADDIRSGLAAIADKSKAIDADIRRDFPSYFNLVSPDPVTLDDIRAQLAPGEVMVYYLCAANDEVFVWAVSRENAAWRKLETSYDDLSQSVGRLRRELDIETLLRQGPQPALFDLGLAHRLYEQLLAPVASVIDGHKDLIVVPSGPLTSLPFQLLVREPPKVSRPNLKQLASYRDADWLMHHYAISMLPAPVNVRSLRQITGRPEARKPFVGFGNPVFAREPAPAGGEPAAPRPAAEPAGLPTSPTPQGQPSYSYASYWRGPAANLDVLRNGLPPLPETEGELKAVARELNADSGSVVLGTAASETTVKTTDLSNYRVVYFATHGLVAGELKGLGEPALAFTVPDKPSELDDGLLTASEVSQLRLDADWVILSACNTAAGNAPGAEALSGLAKSFFHAGARALLVSHWRIGSQAAARLTTAAFEAQRRDTSIGRAEALRRAMAGFIEDRSDPWNAYPTFWGAFVVVGDGRG